MLDWDRTHDWVLEKFWRDRTRITIRFPRARPTVAELAAIRRCVPHYQHMPPADLRAEIGTADELLIGIKPTAEARQLIQTMENEGLVVVAEDVSRASYVPVDRTTGCARLYSDPDEAAAVVREMLAAGVPVNNRE